MSKLIDMSGKRFGSLEVIARVPNDKHGCAMWYCQCDCGGYKAVAGVSLRRGDTKSCGCILAANNSLQKRKHGESHSSLYRIWKGMNQRCYNSNHKWFARYGGRGIAVCDEWRNDYTAFRNWALSNGYTDNLTIERVDNDKGYSPENCSWENMTTQSRNRRTTKLADYSVALIKRYLSKNIMTHKEISKLFGVTESAISCIATGKTWRDIEPA